jgi:hypothetical protein
MSISAGIELIQSTDVVKANLACKIMTKVCSSVLKFISSWKLKDPMQVELHFYHFTKLHDAYLIMLCDAQKTSQ